MLGEAGLELSLLFGQHVIFLLFDLVLGFDCFPCCYLASNSQRLGLDPQPQYDDWCVSNL